MIRPMPFTGLRILKRRENNRYLLNTSTHPVLRVCVSDSVKKNKSCGSPNLSWWCAGTKSADLSPDALGPGVHRMEVTP